jgi:DNA repair exonuclease SbcCD nuclease subunit
MRTLINIKPLYVFGDTHIGVLRGGTTPETKQQLKQDLLKSFQALLDNASGSLLLNGDVFDTDSIDLPDAV